VASTGLSRATSPINDTNQQQPDLLRRAPGGYLWNQAFSLWLFLSLFLYQLVITRALPVAEKGVFELVLTPANVAVYLAALGLESAGAVYLPRMLARHGSGQALAVAFWLVGVRLAAIMLVAALLLWGLPALAGTLGVLGWPALTSLAHMLNDPALRAHRGAIIVYLAGMGLSNLLAALLTALLRTRLVFVLGSLAQLLTIGLAALFVGSLHGGADSALVALALPNALVALAYGIALCCVLPARLVQPGRQVIRPLLHISLAAWLSDLTNGSLIKLLTLLALAASVSHGQIAFFGIAFEMGHAASYLFVAGLGGVGLAVMSVAYTQRRLPDLALAWRTIAKLQMLLAVPVIAFCVPQAGAITRTFYGQRYAQTGALLALFLMLNALVRLSGGGVHEAALYVLGRQRWVVFSRLGALGVLVLGNMLLIPPFGVAGALVAVGLAQWVAEVAEWVLARLLLKQPYPFDFLLRMLLALAPALLFALLWRPASLAGLLLAGIGYLLLFLICLRLIRPLDAQDAALLGHMAGPLPAMLRSHFCAKVALSAPLQDATLKDSMR
jgi:O-antigen/teichoic acid export membrane protein